MHAFFIVHMRKYAWHAGMCAWIFMKICFTVLYYSSGKKNLTLKSQEGAECPIDLNPGCKFKFLHSLEVYLKTIWTLKGTWRAFIWQGYLKICLERVHFRVHLGVHEGPGVSPGSYYSIRTCKKLLPSVKMYVLQKVREL